MGTEVKLIIIRQDVPVCVWPTLDRGFLRSDMVGEIHSNSTWVGGTIDGFTYLHSMQYEAFCNLVQGPYAAHFTGFPLEKIKPTDKIYFNFDT